MLTLVLTGEVQPAPALGGSPPRSVSLTAEDFMRCRGSRDGKVWGNLLGKQVAVGALRVLRGTQPCPAGRREWVGVH